MHTNPKIKICGITTVEEIKFINEYPIAYIGFVFAPSKRQISIEQGIRLRKALREGIQVVGVFVNRPIDEVNYIARRCLLDVVQLHGEETPEECTKTDVSIWKSISVRDEKSIQEAKNYEKIAEKIVYDAYVPGAKGGTGKNFNWSLLRNVGSTKIVLAGGLTPDNIGDAIERVHPRVIDVSSGVESNGKKDKRKIEQMVRRVKAYDS